MAFDLKKKKQIVAFDNPVEQVKDLVGNVVSEVTDVPTQILDQALIDIGLKQRTKPLSGEIDLEKGEHRVLNERGMSQLRLVQRQEHEVFNAKQRAEQNQIKELKEQISAEVRNLQKRTSELSSEMKNITVESAPLQAGDYYKNFFQWILKSLRDLNKRVGESRMWMEMWTQKKRQRGYWNMFKKHGTGFAMSDERAIASAGG